MSNLSSSNKIIVGSVLSPKFREIFNSFKDKLQDDAKLVKDIEEFDPRQPDTFGQSFLLFDGKPGLFVYNRYMLAFTSIIRSATTPPKYCLIFTHSFEFHYDKRGKVFSYYYDRDKIAHFAWDERLANLSSNFARNAISQYKNQGAVTHFQAYLLNIKRKARTLNILQD